MHDLPCGISGLIGRKLRIMSICSALYCYMAWDGWGMGDSDSVGDSDSGGLKWLFCFCFFFFTKSGGV